jgi:hypothetical protein
MKRWIIGTLVGMALIIGAGAYNSVGAGQTHIDRAVVEFDQPVKLQGIVLKGRYLVLHHEGMMARGKPCTYFYTMEGETAGRLVASFHCCAVVRDKVDQFTARVSSNKTAFGIAELEEIQFPGSVEGHRIPSL